jgi:hypothetical protein
LMRSIENSVSIMYYYYLELLFLFENQNTFYEVVYTTNCGINKIV